MVRRFKYLYDICILSIGIPPGGKGDFISEGLGGKSLLSDLPKVPATDVPMDNIKKKYYSNSIEEYRYLLGLANETGSRKGLAKKLKSAQNAVKFLQYAKSQDKFMEFLLKIDKITFYRIPIYSNPSILKGSFRNKENIAIPVDPKEEFAAEEIKN